MRYHVQLRPYSLAQNCAGESLRNDQTLSQHRSLRAAGRALGSLIRGKRRGELGRRAGRGNGYWIGVRDTETGCDFARNDCSK